MNLPRSSPTASRSDQAESDTSAWNGEPRVVVNGRVQGLPPATTVAELVAAWCDSPEGVAVARNREIVPRSQWTFTELEPGDHVEIVTAAAGG